MIWDEALLRWINTRMACLPLDILMSILTLTAVPAAVGLPLIRSHQRRTQESRALICALLLALSDSLVLQFLTDRPRPYALHLVLPLPPFASFPSGHVAVWIGYAVLVTLVHRRIALGEWMMAIAVALRASISATTIRQIFLEASSSELQLGQQAMDCTIDPAGPGHVGLGCCG